MPKRFKDAVRRPNLGLYLGLPPFEIPLRGLKDCLNVRIKQGRISNLNLGWSQFGVFNALSGPVTLIDTFFLRTGGQVLIFGTTKDLYKYNEGPESVSFITPIYVTGTADPTNGSAVVVGGTSWDTKLKAGDEMFFGANNEVDPDATGNGGWYEILTVDSAVQVTLTTNEIRRANNVPEQFRLAVVLVENDTGSDPIYVRGFDFGEPGFAQTSASYKLDTILKHGGPPE